MSTASSEPYFSVSTIKVKPDKIQEVRRSASHLQVLSNRTNQAHECFEEVTKATMENEPGAKMYRFYKVEGKDEFVWIEK